MRFAYTVTAARDKRKLIKTTAYAVPREAEPASEAVARSIARASGLAVVTVRPDSGGIYSATLGTPCRGGGFTPEAEVWFRYT